jgi:predicted transposase YbfD/YdcC
VLHLFARSDSQGFRAAARTHWGIDGLVAEFKEDQSCLRRGRGAKNMARVRHLALNLIFMPGKTSIKGKRKLSTFGIRTIS